MVWEEHVSKADRLDYMMAICSGIIAGLVDVFFVGELSIEGANEWGADKTNKFIMKIAELQGLKTGDLSKAIRYLEKKSSLAADSVTSVYGGRLQHHLRDFSHHFSIGGLLCSLYTQFTGKVIGTDTRGALLITELADKTFIGKDFVEKLLFGIVNWFFHMVSDMAGSNATAGKGSGIPGSVVSLIKELSTLPCFRNKKIGERELHVWVSKLYNGTLLAKRDRDKRIIKAVKFDLRTEIGILHGIDRQYIPVLINECLVRWLYFARRLYCTAKEMEIHSIRDLNRIDISELLPYNNRVIKRMITIASGTFTVIDLAGAAVRAALTGHSPTFLASFAVRCNIIGVGKFIIACAEDGQFITEDILEAREQRDRIEKEYERLVSDLKALSLNYDQMRVLSSLERLILEDDIENTKKEEEKTLKLQWMEKWSSMRIENSQFVSEDAEDFFLPEPEVVKYIENNETGPWVYLIAMEAMLFSPYHALFGNKDKDKALKKIKCKSKYLTDRFSTLQGKIQKKDFARIHKEYDRAASIVTGSTNSIVIGAIGTTAAIAATGGIAFVFAPAIAAALVGEAAAGLSGAALVSYSLAAIGGGSLATGGLGMAGGTAIITGGGALVGMLGGTGVSAATTMGLLADEGYVLSECCKLISFSKEILIGRYKDVSEVEAIQCKVQSRIDDIQSQMESSMFADPDGDEKRKKEMKTQFKVAKKSVRYLSRTSNELKKTIKTFKSEKRGT